MKGIRVMGGNMVRQPMKGIELIAIFTFLLTCMVVTISSAREDLNSLPPDYPQYYVIGPGDVLNISVWKNEDLTRTVPVLPDGKIHFPLIGELVAGGKKVSDLRDEIAEKLKGMVKDPVLTVMVQEVKSLFIYVIGKVNTPGRFILNGNINTLQALAVAGGLNPFAKKEKIKVFREEGGRTTLFDFNYEEVSEGQNLAQNIILKRGDVIVVP